jgi:hypothetical protein
MTSENGLLSDPTFRRHAGLIALTLCLLGGLAWWMLSGDGDESHKSPLKGKPMPPIPQKKTT